jgi:Fe-Mn family superoxide dismutase
MTFSLPRLPYAYNALEPTIDSRTMEIHYTKHHQAYIDNLNKALEAFKDLGGKKVEELLANNLKIVPESIKVAVRNHGGGHANHSLFWELLSSKAQEPSGKVFEALVKTFGSIDEFKKQFADAAMKRFGSGWAWLVLNGKKLEVYSTVNQDSPLMEGKIPLLGLDLWEHAYYLNYQNKRADYVNAFWKVVNWKKVEEIYINALK